MRPDRLTKEVSVGGEENQVPEHFDIWKSRRKTHVDESPLRSLLGGHCPGNQEKQEFQEEDVTKREQCC